jgi:hypothetical protein
MMLIDYGEKQDQFIMFFAEVQIPIGILVTTGEVSIEKFFKGKSTQLKINLHYSGWIF